LCIKINFFASDSELFGQPNTKNYTVLNKKDNELKIELIKIDENNNKTPTIKEIKPKSCRKKKLTKKNKKFLSSLTNDSISKNKIELTQENQEFLDALKT
jgi:hypothetical protein